MPRGPRGEKRPADVIGNAVKVMRIATGEIEEETDSPRSAAAMLEAFARPCLRGLVYGPRMRADKVWNGGRVLDRLKIVEIRPNGYAASRQRPRAPRFIGITKN